jgi:uncharacterized protein YyaL (SSP411 family)
MANALSGESSPYLLQHADNPVDWLPWGPAALERAVTEDKPLLVSIGYSACHWCHVMEHESFEDPDTAALMNSSFVCVKVDREERPDVDALYMEAVQSMTGHGGWPLNVFLTPEQVPFYGGTYYPPEAHRGMPSWKQVLQAIAASWEENSAEIRAGGERIRERLSGAALLEPSAEPIEQSALQEALASLRESYDERHGGFGGAPKFPQAPVIEFLLARAGGERAAGLAQAPRGASADAGEGAGERALASAMALETLRAMAAGGIHDQVGGGFHRYAVDRTWTVPHFEKMLYDNALLARAYLHGWLLSGERPLLDVCLGALSWALTEMRGAEGGFYAALDADSEGAEGRYYLWTLDELERVLGPDAEAGAEWLGVSEEGNFIDPHNPVRGLNVLTDRDPEPGRSRPPQETRRRIRERLRAARATRMRPACDDKRLTSWNALMITALAETGARLKEATASEIDPTTAGELLDAASACAEFILSELRRPDGRLLRSYNHGEGRLDGYLEDHAYLLEALIALFEATCEERWLGEAIGLAETTIARFSDSERGGFFSTAIDGEALLARRKELEDLPIPSGASSAAMALLRLAELTGEERYESEAVRALRLVRDIAPRHPTGFGHALQAIHWHLAPVRPISCPVPAHLRGGAPAQMIDR